MKFEVAYGRERLGVELANERLVPTTRSAPAPALPDPVAAVRDALENPVHFPPLRRALTPDDHVAIFVDEQLPHLPALLVPLLEHLRSAGIQPAAVTLICLPPSTGQPWAEHLPEEFQDVTIEIHDPGERRRLAYLAATRHGRRVYLNRTAVDADQLILLTGLWYDPLLGIGGAEGSLFPTLSDAATIQEMMERLTSDPPRKSAWPIRQEAAEVAWLLGAPFLVQIIAGGSDEIAHVIAGPVECSGEAERLLNERWRVEAAAPADVVLAAMAGDPRRHTFADLGRAFLSASRVVKPGGRIILLTDADPHLGPSAALLRQAEEPGAALNLLTQDKPADVSAGVSWASAAQVAQLYLLSKLPAETVEEMFAIPLLHANEARKLIESAASVIVLPDAHQTLAVLKDVL